MKKLSAIALFLIFVLTISIFSGCAPAGSDGTEPSGGGGNTQGGISQPTDLKLTNSAIAPAEMFTERDLVSDYSGSEGTKITLNGKTAAFEGDGAKMLNGGVLINKEGVYFISGSFEGSITVSLLKTEKAVLVLDGANISCSTTAAINVSAADKVFINAKKGSKSTVTSSFTPDDTTKVDGAVFAKADLTFNGEGELNVISSAAHGIVCKNDLVLAGGNLQVEAARHGLTGKNSIRIFNGEYTVRAGKDGMHAENVDDPALGFLYMANGKLDIKAGGDGLSAATELRIDGGSGAVKTEGTGGTVTAPVSAKAFKAKTLIELRGGSFSADAAEDALHSDGDLAVRGGELSIRAVDKALRAEETAAVIDGKVNVTSCSRGIEAYKVDLVGGNVSIISSGDGINSGSAQKFAEAHIGVWGGEHIISSGGESLNCKGVITFGGGSLKAVGKSGKPQSFEENSAGVYISQNVSGKASDMVSVVDGDTVLLTFAAAADFTNVIITDPTLPAGKTLTIKIN